MTAVASPPSFQHNDRTAWGSNTSQGGLNSMNTNEVARMFMPRKSAQRANSSSSISSNSSNSSTSSVTTIPAPPPQPNGTPMPSSGDLSAWGTAAARKKPQRAGPWPANKQEGAAPSAATARPQSVLATNGAASSPSAPPAIPSSSIVPSQHALQNQTQTQTQQANGARLATQPTGEGNPVLYLLSMNGTFERKTITVPYYPDSLRIGRQTNAKTVPTPSNGYFDSKVLSRQHAEVWADRNGKVWIRDVKSSNGTFVNGARLSPESRDSEPHELQTQDHLELGIDIVSEDQKTVVHHKVAAKVEHAGFSGPTNNVLDMNFGDLDPANGVMMVPSQSALQMRSRSGSQGSVGSNGRLGPPTSVAGSQMSMMGQQRPMNFWLTPVTTEHIVKRLTSEMRAARSQTNDLGRAEAFFGSLLSKENIKDVEKSQSAESFKSPQSNGGSVSLRSEAKNRFSDPPAPPPQQPLPEKPDVTRSSPSDPSPPSLKRANTERARAGTGASPTSDEPSSQIVSLVEALASAKKELDSQSARMRDLEEMLQKERQARELAEELARRLELQSSKANGPSERNSQGSVLEDTFGTPTDNGESTPVSQVQRTKSPSRVSKSPKKSELEPGSKDTDAVDPNAISTSTKVLEQRMETMLTEMQQLRENMESFKTRAETAEAERDQDRRTLAEMVEKIRSEESERRSSSTERASSPSGALLSQGQRSKSAGALSDALGPLLQKAGLSNGGGSARQADSSRIAPGTLSMPPTTHDARLYHATPYASMLGVVLIGMGLMAYINGWQPPKSDG